MQSGHTEERRSQVTQPCRGETEQSDLGVSGYVWKGCGVSEALQGDKGRSGSRVSVEDVRGSMRSCLTSVRVLALTEVP